MKAGGRNLKIMHTRANSWQRPCFLDRARVTGCLILSKSPQLFSLISAFSLYCFSRSFPSLLSREFNGLFLFWALGGSAPHVSLVGGLSRLTTALMRCDKLSKL